MTTYAVSTSAELMENYLQADFLLPQQKFLALQTNAGASLLFSIGTGGVFSLTLESPGQRQGWRQVDLANAIIQAQFGGKATVKTFGAAQAVPGQASARAEIHLAMVIDDGFNDHLYLSLKNSDADLTWVDHPTWTAAPFNAVDGNGQPITPPSPFKISDVFLSEASDQEYIVVDAVRNPGQSADMVSRYFIDGSTAGAPKWQPHDLAIDVQAEGHASCLGRSAQSFGVDGLYTKGKVGTSGQLIYTPLYNVFDPKMPPLPSRLSLPGGASAEAFAAARDSDNSTDLYVAADGALYWFASTNQKNDAVGVRVVSNPLLGSAQALYACAADGAITIWGLSNNDQVFYMSCPLGQQAQASSWTLPLPIMKGTDAISPFIDRNFSANTFFAHTGTGLAKLVKSPTTGIWSERPITLPPGTNTHPATPIHSYTTHLKVTDASGRAAANVDVSIRATNVTSVYINHLYYLIGPSPITITTDALGTVTIVELATTLAGTRFQVSVEKQAAVSVNTMDTAWQRNAKYTTTTSLQAAKIYDRRGGSRDFVPAGTSPSALAGVAASNENLAKAYAKVAQDDAPPMRASRALLGSPGTVSVEGVGGISVDIGDLFRWLEQGIEAFVHLVEDAVSGFWRFVVKIGEAIYHAVLDCVEAVVAAATWIYSQIKIAVEDVIQFLEFLFGWEDILVTHKVLKNVVLRLSESVIDGIDTTKAQLAGVFKQLQSEINKWANIPDFGQSAAATLAANPPQEGQNSAPANLGVHHFQGGCSSSSSNLPDKGPAESVLDDLVRLLEAEGETLAGAANAIKTDIVDQFQSLSVTDVIKRFLAILADTLLQSAENVLLTLLDVLKQLVVGVIEILTARLDIPILGWLYHELTGEDLSFLDLLCLIAAIPVTLIYKLAAKKAPFPADDAFTKGLLAAQSFAQIQAQFVKKPAPMLRATGGVAAASLAGAMGAADDSVLDQAKLKTFGFVAGIFSLIGGVVLIITSNLQRLSDQVYIPFPYAKTLATIACVGNIAYVSPNISSLINARTSNWYANLNNALTGVSILKSMAAIPAAHFNNATVGKVFAFVESFINLVWNVPVIANIVVNKDVWNTTYKSLIPESIGNFAFNIGGILEFLIALVEDIKAKLVLIAVQAGLMVTYGLCSIIAGGIYQFAPDQRH